MVIEYFDKKYNFMEIFNNKTGQYIRTGILKDGKDTGIDPFQRSFPGLLDVGIMGGCKSASLGLCRAGGKHSGCYQGARPYNPSNDMKLEDFKQIVDEGKCHGLMQIALGGAGNPNDHEHFKEICEYARKNEIIPNYTTAGIGLTYDMAAITKEYCGAVAVSWYSQYFTVAALNRFRDAGCKVNIHYVLSKETIKDAIQLLKNHTLNFEARCGCINQYDLSEKKVNAIIFLLYKPVGLGRIENVLNLTEDKDTLQEFFFLISESHPFKIGFDSCSVPGIINYNHDIDLNSLDTCEGGRFSAYINANMIMTTCSFDQELKYGVSLRNHTIKEAWNSEKFESFRNKMKNSCVNCSKHDYCYGGCPLKKEIVLCGDLK